MQLCKICGSRLTCPKCDGHKVLENLPPEEKIKLAKEIRKAQKEYKDEQKDLLDSIHPV